MNKTINECLSVGEKILIKREYNNPKLESRLLLEHILDCDRLYLMMNGNLEISDEKYREYENLLEDRSTGRPIQYILGHQEFMGLDFKLNDYVLVPRPDTEILVEYVLDWIKVYKLPQKDKIRILDIGTGSGAIILSLAYYVKEMGLNVEAWSVDVNDRAIDIARENALNFEIEDCVNIVKSDVFEGLKEFRASLEDENGKIFDIIVSNPPYIPSEVIEGLQKEVRSFEPQNALDGGVDGLDFYRRITRESTEWIKCGGLLAYEIGHDQGLSVSELLKNNFENIEIKKDYGDRDRVVAGVYRLTK